MRDGLEKVCAVWARLDGEKSFGWSGGEGEGKLALHAGAENPISASRTHFLTPPSSVAEKTSRPSSTLEDEPGS